MQKEIIKEIIETYNGLGNSPRHDNNYFMGFGKVVRIIALHDKKFRKAMELEGWRFN